MQTYVQAHHRLGHDVAQAGIIAALMDAGVQNMTLNKPPADITMTDQQAAFCIPIPVKARGVDV